jgi:penicillin-binding protein 1B
MPIRTKKPFGVRLTVPAWWRLRWVRVTALLLALPLAAACFAAGYFYVSVTTLIDTRLRGERDTVLPRVFARPLELRPGQSLTERQLVDRLNDLGYAQRTRVEQPGEFALLGGTVAIKPRPPELKEQVIRVVFQRPGVRRTAASRPPDRVFRLEVGGRQRQRVTLDSPLLTSLVDGEREKRRPVALSVMPPRLQQAVLAIEDKRFYEHPGIDPIGIGGAVFSYAIGRRSYLAGGSTITQQLVRNVFLPNFQGMTLESARARSWRRKLVEVFVSIVLTSRASKDEILEMYLNGIPLGQRGSFAIVGVAEAARLFFGKDVSNLTLAEAATIAGVIQQPSALSPFNNPAGCKDRRNVVLAAMADAGFVKPDEAGAAAREPLTLVPRALEAEAPHFVDFVEQTLDSRYPGLTTTTTLPVDVYTTLDLHLQRLAQDAVRTGLTRVDQLLARRRTTRRAEAALIAVDPTSGEILALVGGRSYNQSQYNRAILSRRQPGSVFKPFVYLTAFEQAAALGLTSVTPSTMVDDAPATFEFDNQIWTPENYEKTYDGPTTFRQALARSRNLATIRVAEMAGYDNVAALWKRLGVGTPPKAFPSIALGVFEATPIEIATAYTLFPNLGTIRPLRHILKITRGGRDVTKPGGPQPEPVARPDTTYVVTDMLRAVINEGTGAGVRSNGFSLDAAGKTGTTNDLRDAWFVGFTPELLTVVWVGYDDNQPLGLSGSQAALPIWTDFMKAALAGYASRPFPAPPGVRFASIDPETGHLATPNCPRIVTAAFLSGTEPAQICELHQP